MNYEKTIDVINQAARMLSGDIASIEAKSYLAMAAGSLLKLIKKNNNITAAHQKMQEAGKKKNEEWQAQLKAITELHKIPGVPPDSV
jgi:hypothetical protein